MPSFPIDFVNVAYPFDNFNTAAALAAATTTGVLVTPITTTARIVVSEVMISSDSNSSANFFPGATTTLLFNLKCPALNTEEKKFWQPLRLPTGMALCITNTTALSYYVSGWFEYA